MGRGESNGMWGGGSHHELAAMAAGLLLWAGAPAEDRTAKMSITFSQRHMGAFSVLWGS